MNKKILLVNLGSPKSLSTDDVREYLREFLSDDKSLNIKTATLEEKDHGLSEDLLDKTYFIFECKP